jgi:hypothetical protein
MADINHVQRQKVRYISGKRDFTCNDNIKMDAERMGASVLGYGSDQWLAFVGEVMKLRIP